jgi:hypothetical protein
MILKMIVMTPGRHNNEFSTTIYIPEIFAKNEIFYG